MVMPFEVTCSVCQGNASRYRTGKTKENEIIEYPIYKCEECDTQLRIMPLPVIHFNDDPGNHSLFHHLLRIKEKQEELNI